MKKLKKLFSMKVAIGILLLLIVACVIGSVIPQQATKVIYQDSYSEWAANMIVTLGFDDVFHSWWFIVLTIFLCVNLLGCNLLRFPTNVKRYQNYKKENMAKVNGKDYDGDPEKLLHSLGFHHIENDNGIYYGKRNTIGVWGAWLTHLGMLIVIIGFSLGQMFTQKYSIYGVPGETKTVEEINMEITIDDFKVELREDETVEQYTSTITVKNLKNDEITTDTVSVNHPTTIDSMKFYQNSTGWATTIEVQKSGETIQEGLVYAGEYMEIDDVPGLVVLFRSFYPNYIDYQGHPATASSKLNNPAYLYMLYYGQDLLGMNVIEGDNPITIDEYSISFKDPRQYTLLQIKHDPYTWLVAIGAAILMIALYLSFYIQPQEILFEDGKVYSRSKKGGILFDEKINLKIEELKGEDKQ